MTAQSVLTVILFTCDWFWHCYTSTVICVTVHLVSEILVMTIVLTGHSQKLVSAAIGWQSITWFIKFIYFKAC